MALARLRRARRGRSARSGGSAAPAARQDPWVRRSWGRACPARGAARDCGVRCAAGGGTWRPANRRATSGMCPRAPRSGVRGRPAACVPLPRDTRSRARLSRGGSRTRRLRCRSCCASRRRVAASATSASPARRTGPSSPSRTCTRPVATITSSDPLWVNSGATVRPGGSRSVNARSPTAGSSRSGATRSTADRRGSSRRASRYPLVSLPRSSSSRLTPRRPLRSRRVSRDSPRLPRSACEMAEAETPAISATSAWVRCRSTPQRSQRPCRSRPAAGADSSLSRPSTTLCRRTVPSTPGRATNGLDHANVPRAHRDHALGHLADASVGGRRPPAAAGTTSARSLRGRAAEGRSGRRTARRRPAPSARSAPRTRRRRSGRGVRRPSGSRSRPGAARGRRARNPAARRPPGTRGARS